MATAQDIVQDSLELLQVYAAGEVVSDADAQRTLSILNDMLDAWSNDSLACYATLEQSVVLTIGKQTYTIGPGGDINLTRPLQILDGPGTAYVQDANGNNYPVTVVPQDQWNLLGNRSNLIQSNFPDTLFYDPQFPLGIINIFPSPTSAYKMFWDSYLQLTTFPSLTTAVSFPPGYKRAIVTNLALTAKPYFKTAQLDPLILAEAMMRLGSIKRTNMRPNVAVMEPELVSRAQLSYNIFTDRVGSSTG